MTRESWRGASAIEMCHQCGRKAETVSEPRSSHQEENAGQRRPVERGQLGGKSSGRNSQRNPLTKENS